MRVKKKLATANLKTLINTKRMSTSSQKKRPILVLYSICI